METFSALMALRAGNLPVTSEFPSQKPVTRSFDDFVDLHLNKRRANNQYASDLRRHHAHYDVTVLFEDRFGLHASIISLDPKMCGFWYIWIIIWFLTLVVHWENWLFIYFL